MRRFALVRLWTVLAVVFFCGSALAATPTGRIDYVLTSFPPSGSLLMHGGWGPPGWQPMNALWKLNSIGWSSLAATGSPAFAHHSATYDAVRKVLVVCGKNFSSSAYEHWEYNGKAWTQKEDIPVGFDGDLEVSYDAARKVIVLYGSGFQGGVETWEYSGGAWRKKAPVHTPVACGDGALLKYDAKRHKTVLVGEAESGTETWLWNGTDWSKLAGPQPPNAIVGGMAFDSARGEMVLITTDMETWTYNGVSWTQESPAVSPSPSPNAFFSLDYDPVRQVCAFFGGEARSSTGTGFTYPTTTWEWNGATWAKFSPSYQLSVAITGAGKVASSPPGISCRSDCTEFFAPGTEVTLTASPLARAAFSSWTGCSSASGSTCTVVMDKPRKVTAVFSTIALQSPASGDTWNAGSSQTIHWTYTGNPGSAVNILLLKAGMVNKVIARGVAISQGSIPWEIPSSLAPGSNYQIKVVSTTNVTVYDLHALTIAAAP